MLPKVSPELISSFLASTGNLREKSIEMYEEMFEQQPVFKLLFDSALTQGWSQDKLDGYCKGMLQAWHLLNQQSISEFLKGS